MSNALKDAYAVHSDLLRRLEAMRLAQQKFLGVKDCPECEGEGWQWYEGVKSGVSNYTPYVDYYDYKGECENCNGSGEIEDDGIDDENWEDTHVG